MTGPGDTGLTLDIDVLKTWVGRRETMTERIDAARARLMQVTLDRAPDFADDGVLPAFWHYLYFNPQVPASRLKEDGHERLGRFLPPVALPRRMWAGGRVDITRPLRCGEICTKTSTIREVTLKQGRTGALCFVTVDHDFSVDGAQRFCERQNIVYRDMPAPDSAPPPLQPAPTDAGAGQDITPDPILLFRYSALIFYSHRIHYDLEYTRNVEGYPGLVVHGPLIAALLAELGCQQQVGKTLTTIELRAHSPLFCPDPFRIEARVDGDVTRTWARGAQGQLAMALDLAFARS